MSLAMPSQCGDELRLIRNCILAVSALLGPSMAVARPPAYESFENGMPQTASLGCGTWGGNITSENISVKHYMNTTWVSRPIPEDKPSEQELLGEFYNSEIFDSELISR